MQDPIPLSEMPILVADDDADDRLLLKMAFEDRNIPNPVLFFNDGCEITDYLDTQAVAPESPQPGLLLLDVNMPRKNGLQVLQELKSHPRWKEICVCMFSTARSEKYVAEAHLLGADNYMVKPDTYEDLLGVVQAVYDNWHNASKPCAPGLSATKEMKIIRKK